MSVLSIIIPTYNEGVSISKTLAGIPVTKNIQVIVSDQAHDQAVQALIAQQFPHVMYIPSTGTNRATIQNDGAIHATGQWLLFLHADSILPEEAYDLLIKLDEKKHSSAAFYKQFVPSHRLLNGLSVYNNRAMRRFGWILGDNGFVVRHDVFTAVGKFPSQGLFEDYELAKSLKKYNKTHETTTCFITQPKVTTSSRKFFKHGVLWTILFMGRMRILYWTGTSPETLQQYYYKK